MCDPADFSFPRPDLNPDDIERIVYRSGSARDGFAFVRTVHGVEVVRGAGAAFQSDSMRDRAEELVECGLLAHAGRNLSGQVTYTLTFAGLLALNPELEADLRHPN